MNNVTWIDLYFAYGAFREATVQTVLNIAVLLKVFLANFMLKSV